MSKKKKHKHRSEKSLSPQQRDSMYSSGLIYFRAGEYDRAISIWTSVFKNYGPSIAPHLAEAHFRNALSMYKIEGINIKDIISEMHSVLKYNSANPLYLFYTGLAYHRADKLSQAISYYNRAIQAAPQDDRYKYHKAIAHLQNGDFQDSITLFESISNLQGQSGEAMVYLSQGDHEKALQVLDKNNNNSHSKLLKGVAYLVQGDDAQAKPFLKTAADDVANKGVPDYYLGIAHARTQAMPSAIKAWEDAAQKGLSSHLIKDDMVNIYRQLAPIYFDRGNLDKVVKIWENLLELSPDDAIARKNLVHAYFLRGNEHATAEKYTQAIRYWQKAWELDQSNPDIAHNLALAHEKQNKKMGALKYWLEAAKGWKRRISANPGERDMLRIRLHAVHSHMADIAMESDNTGRAIAEYRQALRYVPNEVDTIVKLATLYMTQRRPDYAIRELERAHRLSPSDIDILHQMSIAYVMRGDINRSIDCIRDILRIDPENLTYRDLLSEYYVGRAKDARERKRYPAALHFIDEGLEVVPSSFELRALAGGIYLDMEDEHKAELAFGEAIAMNQNDPKAYIAVAHYYVENGMVDHAESYFSQAIDLDPENPHIYIDVAGEYCNAEMHKSAIEYYEKARKKRPRDAEVMIHIISELTDRNCTKHAVHYGKEFVNMAPKDPRSYYHLGLAYHLGRMNDEAIKILEKGIDVATSLNDDEGFDNLSGLLEHINLEKRFGISYEDLVKDFKEIIGDMDLDDLDMDFDDEEEW